MKPSCFVFDIDHTISEPINRWPYGSCTEDAIIPTMKVILDMIAYRNCDKYRQYMKTRIHIIILSGRKEKDHKHETIRWLDDNKIIYEEIYLNPTDPCTTSYKFKSDKLKEIKERYNILWVFDDDSDVAIACKDLGIPSFLFSCNH